MAHSPSRLVPTHESDWFKSPHFDWTTEPGLQCLRQILERKLPYAPGQWQIQDTAWLLAGDDVLCVSATGDGKSALFYMYSLVRDDTITVVLSPTNALELDMVENLRKLGISALAINADTLAAAAVDGRDLWAEARSCRSQIVFFSPETIGTPRFREFIEDREVRRRLGLFAVDECHLVDEWGADFRKAYGRIKDVRPWLPAHTAFLALTATLEPGRQTTSVKEALGLRHGRLHFDKRDCERHNVDIVLRIIQYTSSTHEFRDLDWLIPTSLARPSEVPKTLLYCESIELGHRVAMYLRSLLPQSSKPCRNRVIRHMHSLICAECKKEGLGSLYQDEEARETAIHVTTDVLGVGMNMQDYDRIICFTTPSSLAALIQRIGRAARARERHGTGIVYLKKSDLYGAVDFLEQVKCGSQALQDSRLLTAGPSDLVRAPPIASLKPLPKQKAPDATTSGMAGRSKAPSKTCPSLRLVIAAHVQGVCISRQINAIYENPGTGGDCGRCSSCRASPNPDPRPITAPAPAATMPASQRTSSSSTVPRFFQLNVKDAEAVAQELEKAAMRILISHPPCADAICIGHLSFLPRKFIDRITTDFMLVTSEAILRQRMDGWRYDWSEYGEDLWSNVCTIYEQTRKMLESRHEAALEKQRETAAQKRAEKAQAAEAAEEKAVHEELERVGLGKVRRVILKIAEPHIVSEAAIESSSARKENIPTSPMSPRPKADANDLDSMPRAPLTPRKRRNEEQAEMSPSRRVRRSECYE